MGNKPHPFTLCQVLIFISNLLMTNLFNSKCCLVLNDPMFWKIIVLVLFLPLMGQVVPEVAVTMLRPVAHCHPCRINLSEPGAVRGLFHFVSPPKSCDASLFSCVSLHPLLPTVTSLGPLPLDHFLSSASHSFVCLLSFCPSVHELGHSS